MMELRIMSSVFSISRLEPLGSTTREFVKLCDPTSLHESIYLISVKSICIFLTFFLFR
jgi:hypothetical protein